MGSTIYYFSATGNSLSIALQISEGLGNCAIQSMTAEPPEEPVGGSDKLIGFIFPVFYNGLPRLIKRFVEKLVILPDTYCFAIINSGGSRANTLGMLENILAEKGIRLSYADEVKMPGNYIVGHQIPAPDQIHKLIEAAIGKVDKATKAIAGGKRQPVKRKAALWSEITNRSYLYNNINDWDEKFVTTGKCMGCGLCAKVCPVGNIGVEECRPVWQHSCERCLACIHWCPCEAIEYGNKTIGRTRYHNPNVKVEDIIRG